MYAKSIFLSLISILLFSVSVVPQQWGWNRQTSQTRGAFVRGVVQNAEGEPVPYASVAMYRLEDSSLVAGVASDEQGRFMIEASHGNYYIKITFLSFKVEYTPSFQLKDEGMNLGKITMLPNITKLREVVIEADKSQMEFKLDKRVYNISKDMNNVGATAAEVLDNIPSVEVDVEGKVSLRGSENVRILIDGKPSGLTGISSRDALRQLQGDMVDKVEVITNPSARYDAEGEVGIINIILKKEKRKGINGSFTLQAGEPANHSASVNANWRKQRFNLFAGGSVRYRKTPGGGASLTTFTSADTTYSYDESRKHLRGGLSGNFRLGNDVYLNDKNTITLLGTVNLNNGQNSADLIYRDYDETGVLTQTVARTEDASALRGNKSVDMYYRKTFEDENKSFTINANWEQSDEDEFDDLYELSDDASVDPVAQRTSKLQQETRWLFQADFVQPFSKKGKFETGAKSTLRNLDYAYTLEQQMSDASWYAIPAYNNHLNYMENIYAAYVMAGNQYAKISCQAGLRAEYSDVNTELLQTGERNPRTYLNLFPSAHFTFEMMKDNFLQLSYSRRIRRPRFWYLLPFFSFSDSRSVFTGNPNLDPEFTHSAELGYLKQLPGGSLLASLYYRHTDGVIERINISDSIGMTKSFPVNLSVKDAFGMEVSGSYQMFPWWDINGSCNLFRAITKGTYEQQNLNSDTYAWTARISSKWTIKRKFSCQSSFRYRSARETTQGMRFPVYFWDAGFGLDVLKGKGTITCSARDILNSRKYHSITWESTFTSESEFQWHSRQLNLSFNYRINQKKRRNNPAYGGYENEEFEMGM